MEKEKGKGRPRRWRKITSVLTVILLFVACSFWMFSYYITPGHSLSYFSRFETEAEVLEFLHDNFEIGITSSDVIVTFMDAYPLMHGGCLNYAPTPHDPVMDVVEESVKNVILCYVPKWASVVGTSHYRLNFYINPDDHLVHITVSWLCDCL